MCSLLCLLGCSTLWMVLWCSFAHAATAASAAVSFQVATAAAGVATVEVVVSRPFCLPSLSRFLADFDACSSASFAPAFVGVLFIRPSQQHHAACSSAAYNNAVLPPPAFNDTHLHGFGVQTEEAAGEGPLHQPLTRPCCCSPDIVGYQQGGYGGGGY